MRIQDMKPGDQMDIQAYNELTQLLKSAKEHKEAIKRYRKQLEGLNND